MVVMAMPLVQGHAAQAQSLRQKDMIASDTVKVGELAKEANQACGTGIAFQVDYPSYAGVLDDDNQKPWAYLANATDALKRVCRTDDGKKAVQAKIRYVTVSHGEAEAETLADGEFHYTVPYRGSGPSYGHQMDGLEPLDGAPILRAAAHRVGDLVACSRCRVRRASCGGWLGGGHRRADEGAARPLLGWHAGLALHLCG